MAESDSSDCDIGPALPPHMRARGRDDGAAEPKPSRSRDRDDAIGPVLPPHLRKSPNLSSRTEDCDAIGPAFPPVMRNNDGRTGEPSDQIGPALPPHLVRTNDSNAEDEEPIGDAHNEETSDEDGTYGPALPPGLTSAKHPPDDRRAGAIGPALLSGFRARSAEDENDEDSDSEGESNSDEEELIGPMLPGAGDSSHVRQRSVAQELEARAAAMKEKLTRKVEDVAPSRDSWMTELPGFSKEFGLGPRTFRKNARPDEQDRSGWTDTPADRARKQQERTDRAAAEMRALSSSKEEKKKLRREEKRVSARDRRLAEEVAQHNQASRPESLMDMHTKSRKRKLKEEGMKEPERRPFDRETDLQVNRFDEARRKQLLKKSAHLGNKFSHGSEKTYL